MTSVGITSKLKFWILVALCNAGLAGAVEVARADEADVLNPCENEKSKTEQVPLDGEDASGWSAQIRGFAVEIWSYAQLAANVYLDADRFRDIPWRPLGDPARNDDIGFYAQLYERKQGGELAFVFRGTDDFQDWWNGNFTKKQNEFGLREFDKVRTAHPGKPITLVGHSLGGAIAMHISLRRPDVTVYSFNGSPNFNAPKNTQCYPNERHSVVEHGEILKALRIFARGATQTYTSIGCQRDFLDWGRLISKHSMKKFATCLTEIAAIHDSTAQASLRVNQMKEKYPRAKGSRVSSGGVGD